MGPRGATAKMLNRLLPPASDRFILRNGVMEPVLSTTADTLESITCRLSILLADKESSYEERRLWFAGIRAPPCSASGWVR
jgi:hypothetical protein